MKMELTKASIMFIALALWIKPVTNLGADVQVYAAQPTHTIVVETANEEAVRKDKHCLAVMIYGEAGIDTFYGKAGVAWTAMNRFLNYPYSSLCQVIMREEQFKAMKKSLYRLAAVNQTAPKGASKRNWEESVRVAELVYEDIIPDPTKGAEYFVNLKKLQGYPSWLRKLRKTVSIDSHTFYG